MDVGDSFDPLLFMYNTEAFSSPLSYLWQPLTRTPHLPIKVLTTTSVTLSLLLLYVESIFFFYLVYRVLLEILSSPFVMLCIQVQSCKIMTYGRSWCALHSVGGRHGDDVMDLACMLKGLPLGPFLRRLRCFSWIEVYIDDAVSE